MENVQFEITHPRIIAIIAKQLDVQPEQISLDVFSAVTADEGVEAAVKAIVRTDLATAVKIDRKIKRLEGEQPAQE